MNRTIKNIIYLAAVEAVIAASILPVTANAMTARYVRPIDEEQSSYVQVQQGYNLPGDINGFSFLQLLNEGKGYFGKTTLTRALDENIKARGQIIHANEPAAQEGIGIEIKVPYLPEGTKGSVTVMPAWFAEKEGLLEDKVLVGYSVATTLPGNIKVSSFGEWNVAGLDPKWAYGEISISKQIGDITISYNPGLFGDGDATPDLEHRVAVDYTF